MTPIPIALHVVLPLPGHGAYVVSPLPPAQRPDTPGESQPIEADTLAEAWVLGVAAACLYVWKTFERSEVVVHVTDSRVPGWLKGRYTGAAGRALELIREHYDYRVKTDRIRFSKEHEAKLLRSAGVVGDAGVVL